MIAEEVCKMISGKWTHIPHGWRICLPTSAIRETARRMLIGGARFCALVALPQGDEALRISWNWDVNGVLLSVESIIARDLPLPSIADIYAGADWAERETRDYYAVSFEHRATTPPLMLRTGDAPGVLLREQGERL